MSVQKSHYRWTTVPTEFINGGGVTAARQSYF